MGVLRGIQEGDTSEFALKLTFQTDPDAGAGATLDESASWGGFEFWVRGQNLCAHLESEQLCESVQWYLLPLLNWFTTNWDFIFHEQRLPIDNADADAWGSLKRTSDPPASIEGTEQEASWSEKWHRWWQCHSVMSGRSGGAFPDIVIRRWEDLLEVSWGATRPSNLPDGFRFLAAHGFARVDVVQAAQAVYRVLDRSFEFLAECCPDSGLVRELQAELNRIKQSHNTRRLALLAGIASDVQLVEDRWNSISERIRSVSPPAAASEVLAADDCQLVIAGSPHAALMFGSAAPDLSESDAVLLVKQIIDRFAVNRPATRLDDFVSFKPIRSPRLPPWKEGYQLAEDFLEAIDLPGSGDTSIDIDSIYEMLGVIRSEVRLDDEGTRAVAIAGPRHLPSVVLNTSHPTFQWCAGKRFTLAHELCHLLHDQQIGRRLAMVSGPWAPVDVEKRANAFAAMLLMPPELVRRAIRDLQTPLDSYTSVHHLAWRFQASFSATTEHLANLGFLRSTDREKVEAEYNQIRTAPVE